VPVDWTDDPDSRVDIVQTALEDIRGMSRVTWQSIRGAIPIPLTPRRRKESLPPGMSRQLPFFATIGVASTLAYLGLYLMLRPLGGAFVANTIALALTAIANTTANRRFTFGVAGARNALRDQVGGMVAFGVALALSTGTLAAVHAASPHPAHRVELVALIGANALATIIRFVLLRAWIFHPRRQPAGALPSTGERPGQAPVHAIPPVPAQPDVPQ
jgi:putative flippase GtrA